MIWLILAALLVRPGCHVEPQVAVVGQPVLVTVTNVTKKQAPYGWFAVYDTGPTTSQAVTTLSPYGDNGSSVVSASGGTWVFLFYAQPDQGDHHVVAAYRGIFASCGYEVVLP